jgi:hypothetical protein
MERHGPKNGNGLHSEQLEFLETRIERIDARVNTLEDRAVTVDSVLISELHDIHEKVDEATEMSKQTGMLAKTWSMNLKLLDGEIKTMSEYVNTMFKEIRVIKDKIDENAHVKMSSAPPTWDDRTDSIPLEKLRRHPESKKLAKQKYIWAVGGTLGGAGIVVAILETLPAIIQALAKLFR